MANVRSVAAKAGVSITTVSRVVNNHPQVTDAVRQRVFAAINETGYAPAIGRRSTSNIAFVYTGEHSLGSPFDGAVMAGLATGMDENGFDLLVLDARRSRMGNENFTQMFLRKGVRGAVLRTTAAARALCREIASEGFPAVVIADRFEDPAISYVYSDSNAGSREAINYLIGMGHRRIAICINIVDDSDHFDRLAGYRKAIAENGIEFDDRLVLRVPALREAGAQSLRRLMTIPNRPTAAFLTDSLSAVGLLAEARRAGVAVPQELSIVGFDDTEMRYVTSPSLTAICQNAEQMGRVAFSTLKTLMERKPAGGKVAPTAIRQAMPTWLEIHESTGSVPQIAAASSL